MVESASAPFRLPAKAARARIDLLRAAPGGNRASPGLHGRGGRGRASDDRSVAAGMSFDQAVSSSGRSRGSRAKSET